MQEVPCVWLQTGSPRGPPSARSRPRGRVCIWCGHRAPTKNKRALFSPLQPQNTNVHTLEREIRRVDPAPTVQTGRLEARSQRWVNTATLLQYLCKTVTDFYGSIFVASLHFQYPVWYWTFYGLRSVLCKYRPAPLSDSSVQRFLPFFFLYFPCGLSFSSDSLISATPQTAEIASGKEKPGGTGERYEKTEEEEEKEENPTSKPFPRNPRAMYVCPRYFQHDSLPCSLSRSVSREVF